MKLIQLSNNHYIIVDDSEIKKGDTWYNASTGLWWKVTADNVAMYNQPSNMDRNGLNKITHSTQPLEPIDFANSTDAEQVAYFDFVNGYASVKYIPLQEVKELIGEVDVEKKVLLYAHTIPAQMDEDELDYAANGYYNGYTQALEDTKDKKYTEADIRKAIEFGYDLSNSGEYFSYKEVILEEDAFIRQLQPKTEWEVTIDSLTNKIQLL